MIRNGLPLHLHGDLLQILEKIKLIQLFQVKNSFKLLIIVGGPSARLLSGHYGTEIKDYLNYKYKVLTFNV